MLTRLPPPHRLAPRSAADLLRANLAVARIVALDGRAYWTLLEESVATGVAGGRSYDALIVACAVRARATRILTMNRRDFETLVPTGITLACPLDNA